MIEQVAIAACGVTTVFLSQDLRESRRRWACIFGLTAQPFWFYATYTAEQWGIFALTFLYTLGWSRGVFNHWIRKSPCSLTSTK